MKNLIKKPELVAPAGDLEKLRYAIEYGADAVYCGVPDFSLRVRINQFTEADIFEGIKYAHAHGKKIYITTNIFAHNQHIEKLEKFLKDLPLLPDAFIASDPGVISLIKKILPKVGIHLSTQANCTNWQAAKFWYDLGVKRVVLGREVRLEEIAEIKKRVPKLELEVFVHGAMCMAYSGRCLLSAWLAPSGVEGVNRSANLGDCAQSCRWKYHLVEEMRPGEYMPIEEDEHGSYILNSKDLRLIEYLKDLAEAGVDSFKIEGRAKSVRYLATVVKAYREVIDSNYDKKIIAKQKKELGTNVNRGYTTGFLFGNEDASRQSPENRSEGSNWEFVGEAVKLTPNPSLEKEGKSVLLKVHNTLKVGDKIEIIQPPRQGSGQVGKNLKIKVSKLINTKNNQEVLEAHGGTEDVFILKTNLKIFPMSILRRKK